jgi:hypothetical protein
LQQWAQHNYAQQSANLSALVVSSRGTYSALTQDGYVWQENANLVTPSAGQYMDENTSAVASFVPTTVTTAEVKVLGSGALQAYQRTRLAQLYADAIDPCAVTMSFAFNGVPAVVQTRTWTAGQLSGRPFIQVFQSVAAAYTRSMSIQVTLSDSADASIVPVTGQGVRWAGLALELEAIKDRYPQSGSGNR